MWMMLKVAKQQAKEQRPVESTRIKPLQASFSCHWLLPMAKTILAFVLEDLTLADNVKKKVG
jgi:hypothetical protein